MTRDGSAATPRTNLPLLTRTIGGLLLERYSQAGGYRDAPAAHAHAEHQLGLNINTGGQYRHRGRVHPIGAGRLAYFAPGEVHQAGDGGATPIGAEYLTLYVDRDRWRVAVQDATGSSAARHAWHDPILHEPVLARGLEQLFAVVSLPGAGLAVETGAALLLERLALVVSRREPVGVRPRRPHLNVARDYLDAHWNEAVTLPELATVAGVGETHLCRGFARAFGLPPHRYQMVVRVAQAKALLLAGTPIAQVALRTGFADQAHLTRCFRSIVGITPGRFVMGARAS